MLIKLPFAHAVRSSEITPESVYRERRAFLQYGLAAGLGLAGAGAQAGWFSSEPEPPPGAPDFPNPAKSRLSTDEPPTDYQSITTYNNFYELGTGKSAPARNAGRFVSKPWKVAIEGEVEKAGEYDLDEILRPHPLEERVYRLRCVETWAMVVPWVGFPLGDLLKRFQPTSKARYVEFHTLFDPKRLPGQSNPLIPWPYVEGLRLDEAMHPLTILAVGLYGRVLPGQNGAPLRLVVPWKYGFKSIKSIARIRLAETPPRTTWNTLGPDEYGFYANVNPQVDHPRWSQAKERRIGEFGKRETLLFNGYAEQVAGLYSGLDLRVNF